MKSTGIADDASFGPEAEFFIFSDVKIDVSANRAFYEVDSDELPHNAARTFDEGNMGHRPGVKGGYTPVSPVDSGVELRNEMLSTMASIGMPVEKHHHEVAPAQHELGLKFGGLLETADYLQMYKYIVHNVAQANGVSATFMPKPIIGDNGSGMHVNQSLWKGGKPLFAGDVYAGLSQTALYYIGGIIKHARALNALTNPTTNSYKRLVPGFEAPVLLAYSSSNRSASCRIPYAESPKAKRIEIRFPDPTANGYLAFAGMLMAGLDGIKNKIDPGEAMDQDLYSLSEKELEGIPTVCATLREALKGITEDRDFLLEGGVFTDDQLDAYVKLKMEDVFQFWHIPNPVEFQMYYSC
jgi:glutamine synthetase